jgi:hypothetical protein
VDVVGFYAIYSISGCLCFSLVANKLGIVLTMFSQNFVPLFTLDQKW